MTRNNDTTADNFPNVGDDEDQVANVSGQRWPGAEMRPRGRTMSTTPPGQHLSPRTARMIDAHSGQALGEETERATASTGRNARTGRPGAPERARDACSPLRAEPAWAIAGTRRGTSGYEEGPTGYTHEIERFAVDDERRCIQCGRSLENRRLGAVFCRQKCKRRYYRQAQSSNYDPPLAGTSAVAESRADERFRAQLSRQTIASQPLTEHERDLLRLQRANPGVLLEPLRQRVLERAEAERQAEEEARAQFQPIQVEDPFDPSSLGSLARRGAYDRKRNKPQDPYERVLRPGRQPGPHPWDDEPQCIDKASIDWR